MLIIGSFLKTSHCTCAFITYEVLVYVLVFTTYAIRIILIFNKYNRRLFRHQLLQGLNCWSLYVKEVEIEKLSTRNHKYHSRSYVQNRRGFVQIYCSSVDAAQYFQELASSNFWDKAHPTYSSFFSFDWIVLWCHGATDTSGWQEIEKSLWCGICTYELLTW